MCTNYFSDVGGGGLLFLCLSHLKFSKLGLMLQHGRNSKRATLITKCKPLHCLPMSLAGKQRDCLQRVLREKHRKKYNTNARSCTSKSSFPLFSTYTRMRGKENIISLPPTKRRRKGNKKKFADGARTLRMFVVLVRANPWREVPNWNPT